MPIPIRLLDGSDEALSHIMQCLVKVSHVVSQVVLAKWWKEENNQRIQLETLNEEIADISGAEPIEDEGLVQLQDCFLLYKFRRSRPYRSESEEKTKVLASPLSEWIGTKFKERVMKSDDDPIEFYKSIGTVMHTMSIPDRITIIRSLQSDDKFSTTTLRSRMMIPGSFDHNLTRLKENNAIELNGRSVRRGKEFHMYQCILTLLEDGVYEAREIVRSQNWITAELGMTEDPISAPPTLSLYNSIDKMDYEHVSALVFPGKSGGYMIVERNNILECAYHEECEWNAPLKAIEHLLPPPATVRPNATLRQVLSAMRDREKKLVMEHALVQEDDGDLLGIISERDLTNLLKIQWNNPRQSTT